MLFVGVFGSLWCGACTLAQVSILYKNGIPHGDCIGPWVFVAWSASMGFRGFVLYALYACGIESTTCTGTKQTVVTLGITWVGAVYCVVVPLSNNIVWSSSTPEAVYATSCTDDLAGLSLILGVAFATLGALGAIGVAVAQWCGARGQIQDLPLFGPPVDFGRPPGFVDPEGPEGPEGFEGFERFAEGPEGRPEGQEGPGGPEGYSVDSVV